MAKGIKLRQGLPVGGGILAFPRQPVKATPQAVAAWARGCVGAMIGWRPPAQGILARAEGKHVLLGRGGRSQAFTIQPGITP